MSPRPRLAQLLLALALGVLWLPAATAAGPSFDCTKVEPGSVEELICQDQGLAALDRQLAEVYAAASEKAVNQQPPMLQAEQRGWIKGRDDCWKSDDRRACVENAYRHRIAALQARYRLVPANGPHAYSCDGIPANEVVVTFFPTDPPTLIAERGDSVSLMFRQRSASGTRYQGRNESFWEHQGEATVTWGYGAPGMRCQKGASAKAPLSLGSPAWQQAVEKAVTTGDGAGHGPDLGSQEWMATVSRKLGVFDAQGHGPDLGSDEWLRAVHRLAFGLEPD